MVHVLKILKMISLKLEKYFGAGWIDFVSDFLAPLKKILTVKKAHVAIFSAISIIADFFESTGIFFLTVVILVVFDYITGHWAAIEVNRRKIVKGCSDALDPDMVITSKGKKRTMIKLLAYMMTIFLIEWLSVVFLGRLISSVPFVVPEIQNFEALTGLACLLIVDIELKSFGENLQKITGNERWIPFFKKYFSKASGADKL